MTISEEKKNLFEYAGYSMIGVMLGYSASNLVALVKIIYIGYNQFYSRMYKFSVHRLLT